MGTVRSLPRHANGSLVTAVSQDSQPRRIGASVLDTAFADCAFTEYAIPSSRAELRERMSRDISATH